MKTSEEKYLIDNGYDRTYFPFQTGGGEDESDMTVFVKGNIAIMYDYSYKSWYYTNWDNCNYINGYDYNNRTLFDINDM